LLGICLHCNKLHVSQTASSFGVLLSLNRLGYKYYFRNSSMEAIFRKCTAVYIECPGSHCTCELLLTYLLHSTCIFGSICSVRAPSYLAQNLARHCAFSFIFRGIYDFKDAKAPITAARNTTSLLQRHTANLSSAVPYRLSPGGVKSHFVGTKHKNNSRTILKSTSA